MVNIFEIPTVPGAQKLSTTLSGIIYNMTLRYNRQLPGWILDVDDISGNPLARGIAAVCGVDLVNQLTSLGFPGAIMVQDSTNAQIDLSYDSLGTTGGVFYIPYGQAGA